MRLYDKPGIDSRVTYWEILIIVISYISFFLFSTRMKDFEPKVNKVISISSGCFAAFFILFATFISELTKYAIDFNIRTTGHQLSGDLYESTFKFYLAEDNYIEKIAINSVIFVAIGLILFALLDKHLALLFSFIIYLLMLGFQSVFDKLPFSPRLSLEHAPTDVVHVVLALVLASTGIVLWFKK
jgi:hypothetical protein